MKAHSDDVPAPLAGQLIDYRVEPVAYRLINDTTAALDRVVGTVRTAAGDVRWSVFRKRLQEKRRDDAGRDQTFAPSDDPAHWNYWLRESEAYASPLLRDLAPGLRAPVCYAQEMSAGGVTLWLEDVNGVAAARWNAERFCLAMRHLGRFQGRFVAGEPLPDQPWLSRGHLAAWVPALAETSADPRARRLYDARASLVAAVDGAPRTVCHFDLRGANLFSRPSADGVDETVVVDWSSLGIGALGEDVANAVFDSVWMSDVDQHLLFDLHACAVEAYLAGLHDAGFAGDDDRVRFNYAVVAGLRFGLLTERVRAVAGDAASLASLTARFGMPAEHMLAARTAVCELALELAASALGA